MKVKSYIAILLLVCFSAFLGHNLVPHHHHSVTLLSPLATDCPIEHEDHQCCDQEAEDADHQPDQHPGHCHAFNDVVFEKYSTQLVKPLSAFALVWKAAYTDLVPEIAVNNEFTCYNGQKIPIKTIELCGSRGLRGPPMAA